ncbi:hypothetical protein GLU64_03025 [Nanohaloarchaea archaeon]|nr:hypothetical protein [Candidatus Nanohaloarchaea archaeon]
MSENREITPLIKNTVSSANISFTRERKIYSGLLGLVGFSALIFNASASIVLSLLFVDLLISKWMARSGPAGVGIETASAATILAGFNISPIVGALVGILGIVLRMGVGLSGAFILWKMPGFAALGFLSGTIINSIIPQGIILLASVRTFFILSSNFLENSGIASKISFTVTNIPLVYFISVKLLTTGII